MEDEKLPPNWSSRVDPKYNRRYYYNKVTKQSSWIRPVTTDGASSVSPRAAMSRSDIQNNSETVVDEQGRSWQRVYSKTYDRYYFYERRSGQTSWVHPLKTKTKSRSKPLDNKTISSSDIKSLSSSKNSRGDSSEDEDEDDDGTRSQRKHDIADEDPEIFQKRVMDQFPALKKAFEELEEGQRRLQRERAEHEARVRRELDMVNAKLEELRRATAKVALTKTVTTQLGEQGVDDTTVRSEISVPTQPVTSVVSRPRKLTLEQDLRRYSLDLERRSINVAEKRKSMRVQSGVKVEDLQSVIEEANRLAAERGDAPATAESAALQKNSLSSRFGESKSTDEEGDALEQIRYEMDGVSHGLEYAVKEAEAQNAAAQEAQEAGEHCEYYGLLEVRQEATESELKKAYRKKLIEWHPDKVGADRRNQAVRMTDMVQSAYKVLSDPWEREIYDWFGFEQYLLHVKVLDCFRNYLVAGIELIKHPRKGRPRKRIVWLDRDFTQVLTFKRRIMEDQRTGKEKIKGVPIKFITDVVTGRNTDVLRRTGKVSQSNRYFSLVCADRTLDFECPTEEACMFIATRMKLLIIDLKRDRDWMHRHYDEQETGSS